MAGTTHSPDILMHSNHFNAETTKKASFKCSSVHNNVQKEQCDSKILSTPQTKFQSYNCLGSKLHELPNRTLIFNVEETLLKSSSWFHFFMLVAFEAGGLIRALLLLIFYPFLCLLDKERGLKLMTFICFFGIKHKTFRIGQTVLPKFLLEDVGYEGFELIMRFGKRVAVTNLPRVMVEGFLSEYLGIETIYGRDIKVCGGYYMGVMEDREYVLSKEVLNKVLEDGHEDVKSPVIVGMAGSSETLDSNLFTNHKLKEIYLVNEADKENWHRLPRNKYPKPLIFHDGRLAFLPTPFATLVMFTWLPFGIILCIIRIMASFFLPYKLAIPILAFLGSSAFIKKSSSEIAHKGIVFVSNHKSLLDPVYISFASGLRLTALTYSVSVTSKIVSPIKTITLTRDRDKDGKIMKELLSKGNVAVCPEGTTCREPYLLRFSPLFAEVSDDIVPVALEAETSMFYGTTASGNKALDPVFFLMNPRAFYHVIFLDKIPKSHTFGYGGMSKTDVANYVQGEIAGVLGYTCTSLTRKDKYLMLAGNTGVIK